MKHASALLLIAASTLGILSACDDSPAGGVEDEAATTP